MNRLSIYAAASLGSLVTVPVHAETAEEAAARFGARQSVLDISLSPSGNKVAYIGPAANSFEMLYVVDLTKGGTAKPIMAAGEANGQLMRCDWATESRLVCMVHFVHPDPLGMISSTRLFAVDDDGKNAIILTPNNNRARNDGYAVAQDGGQVLALDVDGKPDTVLMTHDYRQTISTGTRLGDSQGGLGVDEVDIKTGRTRAVESADDEAVRYVADENGRIRIRVRQETRAGGYFSATRNYAYRDKDSNRWRTLPKLEGDDAIDIFFRPVAVDDALNVVYGFGGKNGYTVLYSIGLDDVGERKEVLVGDEVDVDQLIQIGRQKRVVGASYATERRKISYFDEELAALSARLEKALGTPLINIIDASADENALLLVASSDTNPGMVYRYRKDAKQLDPVIPIRAQVNGRTMAEMKPITYSTADGTQVPAYLTVPVGSDGKNLPAIVMPHGGPGSRDEWGFDWLVQFYAARGFAVLQPNYRGSAGFGSDWFGRNGFKAWETAIGDVNDAGRWLVAQGIADRSKLAIVGWSYGGYAALQSQVADPDLFKAVVAIAPVTDFDMLQEEHRNFTNFRLVQNMVGSGDHVAAGSPARHADAFKAPVMLFHGTLDANVAVAESRTMETRLKEAGKQVNYVEFEGLDHYLEDGPARTRMLSESDRFLRKALGL